MLVAAVGAMMSATLFGKPGVVTTRDGQRYEGDVTEKADSVVVNIRGVNTVIARENVDKVVYSDSFDKEFATRLARLAPNDVPGRIALARWSFDQKRYDKAREACELALSIDPNNREAHDLQVLIRNQIRLEQGQTTRPPSDTVSTPTTTGSRPGRDLKTLTMGDVNTIRINELSQGDKVSIRFENDVKKRYVEANNKTISEFNRLKPVEAALEIINNGEEKMRRDIKITGDPAGLAEFRKSVMPIMLNSCATINCHGTSAAGGVQFVAPSNNDQDVYTNFYILTRLGKGVGNDGGGFFSGTSQRMMIERGQGERSILANYMLPKNLAEIPHPDVQGYEFVFRNKDDARYKTLLRWMNETLKAPAPDYGIDYVVPKPTPPASQPAVTGPSEATPRK
jgi:tetratricopeptide (TPR) repeat protein